MREFQAAQVLLLTSLYDFPSDRICAELSRRRVSFARLNRETLSESAVWLDPVAPRLEVRIGDVCWAVTDSLRSVWWRQPTFLRNTPGTAIALDEQLERSQWAALLRSLMLFSQANWVNDPAANYRAECKPWQLRIAAEAGFDVPRTIITNDPEAVVPAAEGQRVALKAVDTVLLREGDRQFFAYTQLLNWTECATPDLAQAPVLVQEVLEPKVDLRVTVVGDRCWCVAILANNKGIEGDWRLQKKPALRYDDFSLPLEIEQRCVGLVRLMGLRYGGIDLALVDNKFFFVEINPVGEWGWLDSDSRPLTRAIVDELER